MNLGSLREVLLRHWPLTIAALCLTLAGTLQVTSMVKPQYTTTGSVLLIPPKSTDEPKSNRYLALGTLDQASGVVIRSLMSEQSQLKVKAAAPDGSYIVAPDYSTNAPILVFTATGDSKAGTEKVLRVALASVPGVLTSLQKAIGVDPSEQIVTQSLTRDSNATVVLKPVIRAVLGVAVLLMGTSMGLIALYDGIQQRRRRRRVLVADEDGMPVDEDQGPIELLEPSEEIAVWHEQMMARERAAEDEVLVEDGADVLVEDEAEVLDEDGAEVLVEDETEVLAEDEAEVPAEHDEGREAEEPAGSVVDVPPADEDTVTADEVDEADDEDRAEAPAQDATVVGQDLSTVRSTRTRRTSIRRGRPGAISRTSLELRNRGRGATPSLEPVPDVPDSSEDDTAVAG